MQGKRGKLDNEPWYDHVPESYKLKQVVRVRQACWGIT